MEEEQEKELNNLLSFNSTASASEKVARVIFCTASSSTNYHVSKIKFSHVIIDEAAQCTEPEALLPS